MRTSWWSCDENRHWEVERARPSRRDLLKATGLGFAAWTGLGSALGSVKVRRGAHDVLVVIFLRGGADGLNIVAPYREDAYYRKRPNLSIASPNDRRTGPGARLLDLNGNFGLHPALSPLLPLYRDGKMAVLHACGSQDGTRSHFEAMAAVERGLAFEGPGPSSGWIARHLNLTEEKSVSPLRAVAFSTTLPDSLRGASNTVAMESLEEFRLEASDEERHRLERLLGNLYQADSDEVSHAGQETLKVLESLRKIDPKGYRPDNGASYPKSDLGNGLRQTACLIKAGLGLEVASLDETGWDTHFAQGSTVGILPLALDNLGKALAAFCTDLGSTLSNVSIVVMTEFGRRAAENSSLGTDHGRASFMFLLGGGVKGGQVIAKWPGLEDHQLDETGDLRVTTDYRDVLSEILTNRIGASDLATVFPGYQPKAVGAVAPRTT